MTIQCSELHVALGIWCESVSVCLVH